MPWSSPWPPLFPTYLLLYHLNLPSRLKNGLFFGLSLPCLPPFSSYYNLLHPLPTSLASAAPVSQLRPWHGVLLYEPHVSSNGHRPRLQSVTDHGMGCFFMSLMSQAMVKDHQQQHNKTNHGVGCFFMSLMSQVMVLPSDLQGHPSAASAPVLPPGALVRWFRSWDPKELFNNGSGVSGPTCRSWSAMYAPCTLSSGPGGAGPWLALGFASLLHRLLRLMLCTVQYHHHFLPHVHQYLYPPV